MAKEEAAKGDGEVEPQADEAAGAPEDQDPPCEPATTMISAPFPLFMFQLIIPNLNKGGGHPKMLHRFI